MEDNLKDRAKNVIKNSAKKILITALPIIIILILLAGALYWIMVDDGTWDKKETSAKAVTSKSTIKNGKISCDNKDIIDNALETKGYSEEDISKMSTEEKKKTLGLDDDIDIGSCSNAELLWELNDVFSKYLDKPEDLQYLINAELVTQFPDLDGKKYNPELESDTSDESTKFDGVIKFRRPEYLADKDSNTYSYLTYKSESDFNSELNKYNSSNGSNGKDVFKWFTLNSNGEVVVAVDSSTTITLDYDDPNVDDLKQIESLNIDLMQPSTKYEATTQAINYNTYGLSTYSITLPFNYLWELLVIGEDFDFVKEVAKLAYDSEIVMTIYDTRTVSTDKYEYSYTRRKDTISNYSITYFTEDGDKKNVGDKEEKNSVNDYNIENIKIVVIDSIEVDVTVADTWVTYYKKVMTEEEANKNQAENGILQGLADIANGTINAGLVPQDMEDAQDVEEDEEGTTITTETTTKSTLEVKASEIAKKEDSTNTTKINKDVSNIKFNEKNGPLADNSLVINLAKKEDVKNYSWSGTTESYERIMKYYLLNTYITESTTYIKGQVEVAEKDDFVTLFNSSSKARSSILEVSSWLFEIIEENEDTADMLDLTKYLLNKATNSNRFGDIELDWLNIFNPTGFSNFDSGVYGDNIEEKVWYTLKNCGFSDYAVAGAMGNIKHESGFRAGVVEYGYTENNGGIGICQWTNSPRDSGKGRNQQLKVYANSVGSTWSDESVQVQFLVAELTGTGDAASYASLQLMANNGYSKTSWKDAATIEEATKAFCWTFERPKKSAGNSSLPKRIQYAQEYYNRFHGKTYSGGSFTKNTTDNKIVGTVTIRGRTFTIFNQNKISGWGSCCNRASQISVCSGYTNASSDTLISKGKNAPDMSCPTYEKLYNEYGLTCKAKTGNASNYVSGLRTQLQNGGYAILYVKGSKAGYSGIGKSGLKWASSMHWVAVLGYSNENGKEKIFISDSGHGNTGWHDIDEFIVGGISRLQTVVFINEK